MKQNRAGGVGQARVVGLSRVSRVAPVKAGRSVCLIRWNESLGVGRLTYPSFEVFLTSSREKTI